MKKTLIFYKPEYADLAIKLRENYRAHDHGEADIVSEEEHDDIEYWKVYWRLRGTHDAFPKDFACEVTIPVDKENPQGNW